MRPLWTALALTAFSVAAHADQTLPEQRSGDEWKGHCAERLERAKAELVRQDPFFKDAIVESISQEIAQTGDPTSKSATDVVKLGISYMSARVHQHIGKPLASSRWQSTGTHIGSQHYRYEPRTDRYGSIDMLNIHPIRLPTLFVKILTPAVDDCLKMIKAK